MNNSMMGFFMNLMRSGGNPQQAMMKILQQQGESNPMMANLLQLAQKGDSAGVEAIARNLCKQRGVDFDSEFKNFKKQLGL